MKRKRLLIMLGSVCLALMLAVPLAVSCGPAAPGEETAELEAEIADLEAEIDELEDEVSAKDSEISDLEDEIAELRVPVKVFEWRAECLGERGSFYYNMFRDFFEEPLEAMAGGRLEIELFGRDEVTPTPEILSGTASGMLELGFEYPGFQVGTIPGTAVQEGMPGSIRTPSDVLIFAEDFGFREWQQEHFFNEMGVKMITSVGEDPWWLWTAEPVKCLDDLKGLKIRCPGMTGQVLTDLGVTITNVAGAEVYTAGMSGVIDGATRGGIAEMAGVNLYEPFPYVLQPPVLDYVAIRFIANMDSWNQLPEDLQQILIGGGKAGALEYANYFRLEDMKALEACLNEGKIKATYTLSTEDQARLQEVKMAQWEPYAAEDPLNAEAIEILTSFVETMGY